MFKKLILKILLLCLPFNIVKLQAKDEKSVASFAITDYKVLAPELGKALVDQGYIEKLYQCGEQTALTKLVKSCYHILDGKLRRTNQVHNAAHYLTPEITAKLVMAVTGNYDQETLIKEWQAVSREHKLQRSHIKDLIKLLNNALIETKDNHLSHLPLAVVIGTLSLHPEAATQIVDFKKAIAQIKNAYSDLSLEYDFESLNIKQSSYPPAFNSINLGYKGKSSAPLCVEDALRNICYALLWNTKTACLDLKQINQDLSLNSNFLNFISKYQDGKNITSIECAQDWLNLVSGLDNVQYFRTDYELCGHVENGLKVLNYLFGTKAKSLSQFLDQVSSKQKHLFAGNYSAGEISLKKGNCDFKILVNFACGHAQADIQRPNNIQADIARSLIDQISNDLSKCHQKIGLLLLVSKFKDLYSLHLASQDGKTNLAKLLIDAGADLNARNDNGYTALMYAWSTEIASILIAGGSDVNAINNSGLTALMYAASYGHTEIVKLLINAGADVNTKASNGNTALMYSARTEIAKLLINAGADVSIDGYPVLLWALAYGHIKTARLLIAAGADVNATDRYGSTALMYAASYGHTEIVKLLINAGADVNTKASNGFTALLAAAQNGRTEIAKLLIDAGADINAKTSIGFTALLLAAEKGHTGIATLLIDAGADVNDKNYDGGTTLMYAASYGHTEIVKLLIDAGADVNYKYKKNTALKLSIANNHKDCAKLLINAGAACSGIDKITLFILKHPNLVKAVLFSLIVGIGYNLAENSNS